MSGWSGARAVAGDVEALAEIRLGVPVDRRMPHDLAAERQIADVVLADLEGELVGLGPGEELRCGGEGVLGQARRHAVIGDHEKPGVFASAGEGARERCCGAGITGEVRSDVEHRNASVLRGGRAGDRAAALICSSVVSAHAPGGWVLRSNRAVCQAVRRQVGRAAKGATRRDCAGGRPRNDVERPAALKTRSPGLRIVRQAISFPCNSDRGP